MSSALVHAISSLSATRYGVNVLEQAAPASVQAAGSNILGMVADLPWGPTNTVTLITSLAEFMATFYPDAFSAGAKDSETYPAIRALLRKRLPGGGLKVVRIASTSAAQANSGAVAAGTGSVTITANYPGALGNEVSYQFVAATDSDAAKRNLVISIGSAYSATYENLTYDAIASMVSDPYITVTASSPSAMPAVMGSATALASGANGTAVAGDYVGGPSSDAGIRKFYSANVDVNVIFVAECPSGLVDTVNAGLVAWGEDTGKGIAVLCTPAAQDSADTLTYVSDNSLSDDRSVYTWPQIETRDLFDGDMPVVQVDGNAFAAFATVNVDPWLSPGGNGKKQGAVDLMAGIVGIEDQPATLTTLNLLDDVGVAPWFNDRAIGIIIHRAVTTDGGKLFSRRAKDWIQQTLAGFAVGWVETQLDLVLSSQTLGPNTGGLISAWLTWLENQKIRNRIQDYSVDPFSANSQTNIDAGQWIVIVKVKLYGMIEELVILSQIGETVQIVDG